MADLLAAYLLSLALGVYLGLAFLRLIRLLFIGS
jgi:hypothetical protein